MAGYRAYNKDLYHGFDIEQVFKIIHTAWQSTLKLVKWPSVRVISFEVMKTYGSENLKKLYKSLYGVEQNLPVFIQTFWIEKKIQLWGTISSQCQKEITTQLGHWTNFNVLFPSFMLGGLILVFNFRGRFYCRTMITAINVCKLLITPQTYL